MANCTLRIKPEVYLQGYPNGPLAELATAIVEEKVRRYRREFDDALKPALVAFQVLVEQLGKDLHNGCEDGHITLHGVFREWLNRCLPDMDLPLVSLAFKEFRGRELLLRREIVRRYGLRLDDYRALGPLRNIPVHPWFWKLKEDPLDYLSKRGYRKRPEPQNVHLTRAALAPEAAMWQELQQVEHALRFVELSDMDSGAVNTVYRLAMEQTDLRIVIVRYNNCQSIENFKHIIEWLESSAI
jgi:hypothetical protein